MHTRQEIEESIRERETRMEALQVKFHCEITKFQTELKAIEAKELLETFEELAQEYLSHQSEFLDQVKELLNQARKVMDLHAAFGKRENPLQALKTIVSMYGDMVCFASLLENDEIVLGEGRNREFITEQVERLLPKIAAPPQFDFEALGKIIRSIGDPRFHSRWKSILLENLPRADRVSSMVYRNPNENREPGFGLK